jgi:hypothetical protein
MTWHSLNRGIPSSTAVRALVIAPSITTAASEHGKPGLSAKEGYSSEPANSLKEQQPQDTQALPPASTSTQQAGVISWLIKSGIIVDSFEPGTDSFSIILSPCAGLRSATQDLSGKPVYVEVGPFFSGYLTGNLFEEKGEAFLYRYKDVGKQEYKLVPEKDEILILAKDIELSGIKNPINVKVRVGDWICASVGDWRNETITNASKFQLP